MIIKGNLILIVGMDVSNVHVRGHDFINQSVIAFVLLPLQCKLSNQPRMILSFNYTFENGVLNTLRLEYNCRYIRHSIKLSSNVKII